MLTVTIDGLARQANSDELLIDLVNRIEANVPHVCYHQQLGPIQTCDTCMVEVDGKLVRACGTMVSAGMKIATRSARANAAQREAFDRILSNHLLYCTVCDNNNGNCTVHNATKLLAVEHQRIPYQPKPYEVDDTNPFYRYDPQQCILCGRCVEACQNLQVNETLSIRWEDLHPRVLWDGRLDDRGIELRIVWALRHRLSVQRADGKIHARACRLFYRASQAGAGRHDRYSQRRRTGNGLWGYLETLRGRIGDA
ncbi:MAG: 2Fe-2S iron-sulfur cluster-binding protein [Candidatus Acidiferrales bacterium]